ncbi:unnamed protein product [Brachionus calyciflorus]|uniref:Uncharacterized protein n=1 Tax=Brachionus calyciflorus TaxID=104777 RepID=A0A813NQM6_9BILA|nr:unnamed protein product [Brachionus calyciflorus]
MVPEGQHIKQLGPLSFEGQPQHAREATFVLSNFIDLLYFNYECLHSPNLNLKDSNKKQKNSTSNSLNSQSFIRSNEGLNKLTCYYTNATSLRNKINELKVLLTQFSYDLIGITETWFKFDSLCKINGYKHFSRDRQGAVGGGVIIYVKDLFKSYEVNNKKLNSNELEQI